MTKCSILWCDSRKGGKYLELTLYRFPRNVNLRKRWIGAIGVENIKPNLKALYICSLHFEESCFNMTLDAIRLHDNTIPSILLKKTQNDNVTVLHDQSNILHDRSNIEDSSTISSAPIPSCKLQKEHDQVVLIKHENCKMLSIYLI